MTHQNYPNGASFDIGVRVLTALEQNLLLVPECAVNL
jgi:hypothetical protein